MDKLLILGASYHEIAIINRARNKGIYTIVTDNHVDWSMAPAKYVADEAWNISWSDIETLIRKCKETEVSGIMAGFSEFRVENMIILCGRLGLPSPLTMEQLDITRDKIKFKRLCQQYDIPIVPEYNYGDSFSFPVIIKPVDRAGSIGINVAYDNVDFETFYQTAYDLSPSKNVIIEEFINDGVKVDFYYFAQNGQISLLGTSDTIMCEGEDGAPILQKAWVFPSHFENRFITELNCKIKQMLQGINIHDGYATMSAFYRNGKFYFFEAGFRLSGELSYNYYAQLTGINYIDTLIDYALSLPNNHFYSDYYKLKKSTKSIILNFFGINGTVHNIRTVNDNDCLSVRVISDFYIKEGDTIHNETTVFKKIAMYTLFADTEELLEKTVKDINQQLSITDDSGVDLIYERVNENSIFGRGGLIPTNKRFRLISKPYYVTWGNIQALLNKAHQTNIDCGLIYATYNQSISRLKEKTKNSTCLVVLDEDDTLAATATVQFRTINHWYHDGEVGLLKLLAVSPDYRGWKFSSLLTKAILYLSEENEIEVVVSDSAEHNEAVKHLYLSEGFKIVDCCKYANNNFISVCYAKWLILSPFTDEEIAIKYAEKRSMFYR